MEQVTSPAELARQRDEQRRMIAAQKMWASQKDREKEAQGRDSREVQK